jgi:ribosomal protein S18 acetylase RimI-like enzyme
MSIIFTPDENYYEINGNWLTNDKYASIHRIAISNNYHYKGIGVKMLLEAEAIVKNKKVYSIKIDTHKKNIPMSKTIEKAGYKYCGIITLKRSNIDNLRNAYEKRLDQ